MRTIRKKPKSQKNSCLTGEADALPARWQEWIELNSAKLLNYARQQTRCEHDAEDVLQDSIARMWKLRRRCPDGVPAMSFAYQTIRCRAIDIGRQLDRRSAREDVTCQLMETEKGEWFEDDLVEKREVAGILRKALRGLPSKLREVIELKIWGGLTFAQIAKKVGAPLNTVTSRYRYALAHLRREVVPLQLDLGA
ncbi:MAG: RNA polymerase sigma factor [Verrucomicrobiales bacterium]